MLNGLRDWLDKDRKRAEVLQRHSAQLESILNAAPDFYAGWSKDGVTLIAPGLRQFLGLKALDHPLDIEQTLTVSDGAAFHTLVERLTKEGVGFEMNAALSDELSFCSIRGSRTPLHISRSVTIDFYLIWVRDTTTQVTVLRENEKNSVRTEAERERLQALFDLFPRPLWLRDADMGLRWCNQAYANALDLSVDQALQQQKELFITPNDRTGHDLAVRAMSAGKPYSELRPVVIKGNRRLMEVTEWPFPEGPYIAGFALDQTRLDDLQAELNRHMKAHAAVLQTMTTAIAVFGSDTRLRFFNHAYQLLMGLDERWLETEPTMSEVLEALRERRKLPEQSDFPRFKKNWLKYFTDLLEPHEELLHLPDGSALRMVVVPHPLGGLLFTFEDITDRFTLESSYNTLIEVQRATLNHLGEAVALFGADGRLKLWNPAYCSIWQFTEEELEAQPHVTRIMEKIHDFFEEDDWQQAKPALIDNVLGHSFSSARLTLKDGQHFEVSTVPLPDGAVLCRFLDVTDSQRIEAILLEKSEALEAADHLKTDFLINASYQLRTPLNSVIGFNELLCAKETGALNPRQQEYADNMRTAGLHLQKLVDDILDLASVEAGLMELHASPIAVKSLLQQVYNLSIEWARRASLALVLDCADNVGEVTGDEMRLRQVLMNLVNNAIKWTPYKGKITLSAKGFADRVVITVSDTGSGIKDKDSKRIFLPFERGDRRDRKSGAGLGLALVRRIVELHGGNVQLQDNDDKGTSVIVELPRGLQA